MGNLKENSRAYNDLNYYYELFSIAEDAPRFIDNKLENYVKNKVVLDAGCGTGKYTNTILKDCKSYVGIDKSEKQIEIAKNKFKNQTFIIKDLSTIDYEDNFFDIVISCWCLGTIDLEKRKYVLNELKRVCKETILLIENLEDSEFEIIRNHDKDKSTKKYIDFLKENGFELVDEIDTYFQFETCDIAKQVFEKIYNKEISEKISDNIIGHKVGFFRMDLK